MAGILLWNRVSFLAKTFIFNEQFAVNALDIVAPMICGAIEALVWKPKEDKYRSRHAARTPVANVSAHAKGGANTMKPSLQKRCETQIRNEEALRKGHKLEF